MAYGDEGFSTRTGQGGFTGGAQMHDMAADPTWGGDSGASSMASPTADQMADLLDAAADVVGGTAVEGGVSMGADYSGLMGADVAEQDGLSGFELANQGLNEANQLSTDASNITQDPMSIVENELANMSDQPSLQEMQSLLENAGLTGMSTSPQDVIASGGDVTGEVPLEGEDPSENLTAGEEVNQFLSETQGGESISEKLDKLNQTAQNIRQPAGSLQAGAKDWGTSTGQGGFTGGSQMFDMGMDPTFANTGGWGPPQTTVNIGPPNWDAGPKISQRLNNLPAAPDTWSNPYVSQNYADYAMAGQDPRLGQGILSGALANQGPDPTTNWAGGFNPNLDNYPADWENVTQGMMPQGVPRYSSPLSPEGALTAARPEFSSPFSPEGALTADQIGPTSPFTSPLSPEGAISGPISPYDASLALDEYEIPSRQQQRRAASVAASPFDAGVMPGAPTAPAFSSPISPEGALVADTSLSPEQAKALLADVVFDDDPETVAGKVEKVAKKSSKLTKAQKKANMDIVRARWQARVDHAKTLKDKLDAAVKKAGGGFKAYFTKEVGAASKAYGAYVRSDEYVMANSRLNPSMITGLATGGVTKIGNMIQDIFHSWGKTDPRTPEKIEEDLIAGTNSYTGEEYGGAAEVGAPGTVDWMRNNYTWARNLPNKVLRNAIKYPDYLRLILNAVADGKKIPLTVPDYILNPSENGDDDNGDEDNGVNLLNHPALQPRTLEWSKPGWMS